MVYHDITHFVVVDPLRQPLVSKSDRHPVGTLHEANLRDVVRRTFLCIGVREHGRPGV
jgi:hypothetical protein